MTKPTHSQIEHTLAGLVAQSAVDRLREIIIVDAFDLSARNSIRNGDTGPRITVIPQSKPNHSAALHQGARAAAGDLIWFVADDFMPEPGVLAAHLKAWNRQPDPATVVIGPGRFEPRLLEHPFRRWLEFDYDLKRMAFRDTEEERQGFFYVGNTMFHRGFYLSTGGFDPEYPHEVVFEQELELRLSRSGARTVFAKDALAVHIHTVTLSERCRTMGLAGESCARLKTRYRVHPILLPECTMDEKSHLEAAAAARRRFGKSRSPRDREDWWRNRLVAAFLKGYASGWRRIEAGGERSAVGRVREEHVRRDCVSWQALPGGPETDGLEQFDTADSRSRPETGGPHTHLRVHNPRGLSYAYFRAAPGFASPDTPVELSVLARDNALGMLWVEYDSTDPGVNVVAGHAGAFKKTSFVLMRGDGAWKTYRFEIPDGRWQTRLVNGGDLRIVRTARPGRPLLVSRVELKNLQPAQNAADHESPLVLPPRSRPIDLAAPEQPDVSIVIPAYMHTGYTFQCLQAISAHTAGSFEVIVVDDCSPDHPCAWLAAIPGLRFLRLDSNGGYARACNAGARLARGRWLVFLNNDTLPQSGWLDALVGEAQRHPGAGAIGARLLYPATGAVQHAGVDLDDSGLPFHPRRYERLARDRDGGEYPAVTGACLLTPRDLFESMSGFDERYVNGCEDIDYCLRLHESGRTVRLSEASTLGHYESVTIGRVDRNANERNLELFRREWIDTGRWRRALEASGRRRPAPPDAPRASRVADAL